MSKDRSHSDSQARPTDARNDQHRANSKDSAIDVSEPVSAEFPENCSTHKLLRRQQRAKSLFGSANSSYRNDSNINSSSSNNVARKTNIPAIIRSHASSGSREELIPDDHSNITAATTSSSSLESSSSSSSSDDNDDNSITATTKLKQAWERRAESYMRKMPFIGATFIPGLRQRSSDSFLGHLRRKETLPGSFAEAIELIKGELDDELDYYVRPSTAFKLYTAPPKLAHSPQLPLDAFLPSDPFRSRPNKPLEPDEYEKLLLEVKDSPLQGVTERSVYSLFLDDCDIWESENDPRLLREARRVQALETLKGQTVAIEFADPEHTLAVDRDAYRFSDGSLDYPRYLCALSLTYVHSRFRNRTSTRHKVTDEFSTDKFIHSLARLVSLSGPYQNFFFWSRSIIRWDDPRASLFWCVSYFVLLFMGVLGFAIVATPAVIIAFHRLRPNQASNQMGFDRLDSGIIDSRLVYLASKSTLGKTKLGKVFWNLWRRDLGSITHVLVADTADLMERIKKHVVAS
ncbi:hypothetical protein EV182_002975 [Spiromyces aspiralis]|uniref:Uncharacterized protein n=1 Tax=Spiromyces aspiralis TaxID=68401 RepID=A0ACC1HE27_9FUNG|nr:hypothetical protein EV182_002975 [Spiromyces aspiralis]